MPEEEPKKPPSRWEPRICKQCAGPLPAIDDDVVQVLGHLFCKQSCFSRFKEDTLKKHK